MSTKSLFFTLFVMLLTAGYAHAGTPAPEGARVYIVSPADGEVVNSPFKVVFGLSGMGVAPAGIDKDNTGHHHLLIDLKDSTAMDKPLPSDNNHRHFGGGQTETTLQLPPGKHTLQLIMGDKNHVPHTPPVMSKPITVVVK